MNLMDEVEKIKIDGYSEANAEAKLCQCINRYIFSDETLGISDMVELRKRADRIFTNATYKKQVERSRKNWLTLSVDEVFKKNLDFIGRI